MSGWAFSFGQESEWRRPTSRCDVVARRRLPTAGPTPDIPPPKGLPPKEKVPAAKKSMGWLPDGDDDDLSFETTPRGPPPGPLKPLPPRSTKRRAVVVDSDLTNFAGDFWGLAYLLSSKDCDVVYVMASGGDTRMKMRILSKFLAHCGREDVEVGAGPPGAEPGWLKPDARGSYRPAAEWSEGCVPHPVLRDWAKHYDDSRHLARGQFYDPVVRLRDRLRRRTPRRGGRRGSGSTCRSRCGP